MAPDTRPHGPDVAPAMVESRFPGEASLVRHHGRNTSRRDDHAPNKVVCNIVGGVSTPPCCHIPSPTVVNTPLPVARNKVTIPAAVGEPSRAAVRKNSPKLNDATRAAVTFSRY